MGKDKLRKFRELDSFSNSLQPSMEEVRQGIALQGKWAKDHFGNDHPVVIELGCGHGDYTVALSELHPDTNFIGVDIKGARMWRGAKTAMERPLTNAAFLRTRIEWITGCFGPGEVDAIWITFPDPQIKYQRAKHRMVSPKFLEMYRQILKPGGRIHLKCDSEFLHGYTHGLIEALGHKVHEAYHDIDDQIRDQPDHPAHACTTYYEQMWREQGKAITYLEFSLEPKG